MHADPVFLVILSLSSTTGVSTYDRIQANHGTIAVSLDAASHTSKLHAHTSSQEGSWPSSRVSVVDRDTAFISAAQWHGSHPGVSSRPKHLLRRELDHGDDPNIVVSNTDAAWPIEYNPVRYNTSGMYRCAEEGGDCCCEGEVRMGKYENWDSSKISQWTAWRDSTMWVDCSSEALGGLHGELDGTYCECNGRCPIMCPAPSQLMAEVAHIHPKPCAEEEEYYTPGHKCTLQCLDGYTPNYWSLLCRVDRWKAGNYFWQPSGTGGSLSDMKVTCDPVPCAAPTWVENAEDPPCKQGNVIFHGGVCAPQCKQGHQPSAQVLTCGKQRMGELTPMAFYCKESPCTVNEGWITNEHADGACKEGDAVTSGHKCTTQCKQGYRPSVDHLLCSLGAFTPHDFACQESPCAVPVGVANANVSDPCEELWNPLTSSGIPPNRACTPQCKPGFKPDVSKLTCSLGELQPKEFSCVPDPCEAPTNISNGALQLCREGNHIMHDYACTSQCEDGYEPTVSSLSCAHGQLSPTTFECAPSSCKVPQIANAPDISCEGRVSGTIPHQESCLTTCESGWHPDVTSLLCWEGQLSPAVFQCKEHGCAAPSGVANGANVSCVQGTSVEHGSKCTPVCAEGYEPSLDDLTCVRGLFQPSSFTCHAKACDLPTDVQHAAHPLCVGTASGEPSTFGKLSSGASCAPQCRSSFFPSSQLLACHLGQLSPQTFTCGAPTACDAHHLKTLFSAAAGGGPCWEGQYIHHHKHCHLQCEHGFTASTTSLQCLDGNFTSTTQLLCTSNAQLGTAARCLAPTGISYQEYIPCAGDQISFSHNQVCHTRCADGYSPSVAELACVQGSWSPATFACLNPSTR